MIKRKQFYIWIIVIGCIVYAQALFFGFTWLDDDILILQRQHFLSNISNIFTVFRQGVFHGLPHSVFYYRPVLTASFILDTQLYSACPFIYHFTNIAIHLLASCLVFLFFKRLERSESCAFLCAVIFSAHPVLSQAVAWIPGRNDSLLTVFVILSFIAFLDFLKAKRPLQYFLHLLFLLLALLTKESGVLLLVVCVCYLYLIGAEKPVFSKLKAPAAGWFFILVLWLFLRNIASAGQTGANFKHIAGLAFSSLPAVIVYIGKIILPVNLSVLPVLRDSHMVWGVISIAVIAALLFLSGNKRYNFVLFGFFWFILFLLPTLMWQPMTTRTMIYLHEHRIYLPIAGFFIILSELDFIKNINFNNMSARVLSVVAVIVLSVVTALHSVNFRSRVVFWENAAASSPHSAFAHLNLGSAYFSCGLPQDAQIEYKKALQANPKEPFAHHSLALVYLKKGLLRQAEAEFKQEINNNPAFPNAYASLGRFYFKQGRLEEAERFRKKASEISKALGI